MKSPAALTMLLFAAPLAAQSGVEQIGRAERRVEAPQVRAGESILSDQISTTAAELDAGTAAMAPPQNTSPAGRNAQVAQMRRGPSDRVIRVQAPPPEAVDACTEAVRGRRAPPKGVDCNSVLQANARRSASDLSAEEALVAGVRGAGNEVSIRRLENASPEEIARRLASGYLVNAPAAQAVGSGQPQEPAAPSGIVVIPDPSRSPDAPPVQVGPNR